MKREDMRACELPKCMTFGLLATKGSLVALPSSPSPRPIVLVFIVLVFIVHVFIVLVFIFTIFIVVLWAGGGFLKWGGVE